MATKVVGLKIQVLVSRQFNRYLIASSFLLPLLDAGALGNQEC
jgi:hypothetical protein